jgi:hypothetical protein
LTLAVVALRRQRGQTSAEYLGVLVVVGAIVAALVVVGPRIAEAISNTVDSIAGGGDDRGTRPAAAPPPRPGTALGALDGLGRPTDASATIRPRAGAGAMEEIAKDEPLRFLTRVCCRDGGLLAWGASGAGDPCFWHVRSEDPASWVVFVQEARGPDWHLYEGASWTSWSLP